MTTKAGTLHRELTAAWMTAGVLILALALAPNSGQQAMQRSLVAVIESTLTPLTQRAADMFHFEPLRPWAVDALDGAVAAPDSRPTED